MQQLTPLLYLSVATGPAAADSIALGCGMWARGSSRR